MYLILFDATTSADKIGRLIEAIGRPITSKPEHWKETFALIYMDCAPDS